MKYIYLLFLTLTVNACSQPLPQGVQTIGFAFTNPANATSTEQEANLLSVLQARLNAFYEHPVKLQKVADNEYEMLIPGQIDENLLSLITTTPGNLFFAETLTGEDAAQAFRGAGLAEKLAEKLQYAGPSPQFNDPVIGFALPKDTAFISAEIKRAALLGIIPGELSHAWGQVPIANTYEKADYLTLYAIRKVEGLYQGIKGKSIILAKAEPDQIGRWAINMRFDDPGANKWAEMTEDRVNDFIAMLIDGKAWSVPKVNSPITGGQTMLSADFEQTYAETWAAILQGGRLPAAINMTKLNFNPAGVFEP
ncbi:MAG: hypothetical protein AAFN10_07675 [Bacteroidota bacterium]